MDQLLLPSFHVSTEHTATSARRSAPYFIMSAVVPNRGPELFAVNLPFLIFAVVATALRCFVRIHLVKGFSGDDVLMLIATMSFCVYIAFSCTGIHYGTGRHIYDLTEADNATAKSYWWGCYLAYGFTMIMAKSSIAWFLLRVAVKKLHIWIIRIAALTTIVSCITFIFVTIFECRPVSYFWDRYTQEGTCLNSRIYVALAYIYSTCSILTDITFALLPAWIIAHLQMKRRTKLALIPLLVMGCVASAAVVARLAYVPALGSSDFLWDTLDIAIWSTVEQGLAITAGSLATLRPLVKLVGYKLGLTTSPTGRYRTNSNYKLGSGLNRTPQPPRTEDRINGSANRGLNSRNAGDELDLENFAAYGTSAQVTHEKRPSHKGGKNEIFVASQIQINRSTAEDRLGNKKLPSLPQFRSDNPNLRSESVEALRVNWYEGRDSDEQQN